MLLGREKRDKQNGYYALYAPEKAENYGSFVSNE